MTDKLNDKLNVNLLTTQKDIKNYIKQLKSKLIYFFDIPEELRNHPLIVSAEREYGIRKSVKKGYDVIHNYFFIEELVQCKNWLDEVIEKELITTFEDFNSYYEFLQGDIYENACYYKYNFSQDELSKYAIDLNRINFKCLISCNIDDFTLEYTQNEIKLYKEKEKRKKELKKWIEEFDSCNSYEDFKKLICNFNKSKFAGNLKFFLFNFIRHNKEKAFDIVISYLNNEYSFGFEKCLCLIYEPQKVYDAYNNQYYSQQTAKKYKKDLKHFIEDLENKNIVLGSRSYFDEETHYFIYQLVGRYENSSRHTVEISTYFDTFDELAAYVKYDLSYCDLSKAILPNLDLSKYKIDEHTNLPIQYQNNLTYILTKQYDRHRNCFSVVQTWTNENCKIIKSYSQAFKYFFDFVHFLKKDLSNADLLFCDGLANIKEFDDLDFTNTRLKSNILDKLNIEYELIENNDFEIICLYCNFKMVTYQFLMAEH